MDSDESDDEPLSVLAAAKKLNPESFRNDSECKDDSKGLLKNLAITIKLNRRTSAVPAVVQRPTDVWLYLKDFNTTGPYSCLLCPDWFINRPKIIIHYVLNHKKDFCGICRYFVSNREAWVEHEKFHKPWPCSQCMSSFPTEDLLRDHFRNDHNLVHCRLCHFRVPADENYNTHLLQKHNVANVASIYASLWALEGTATFTCLLCSKSENLLNTFFSHYMGYHHFTLKCFASMVSGKDPPFTVKGVDVSSQFINDELKGQTQYGYVVLEKPIQELTYGNEVEPTNEPKIELNDLIPEVKTEIESDDEDFKKLVEDANKSETINEETIDYQGEEDFDITLTEIVLLEKCYFDYISQLFKSIDDHAVPEISAIDYNCKSEITNLECTLCNVKFEDVPTFTIHMNKMHCVKTVPLYSCRVCATTFDTLHGLTAHIAQELGDFEDLWICQFCDKEFDNREATRRHLSSHWDELEYDNCFSPHLGFKCKYCPTLFWNEPDRELHQINVHFEKYKDQFYKCEDCSLIFGDKIWFIHHYMQKHETKMEASSKGYLLKCSLCCLVKPNVDDMRTHFEECHPEAKKLYCSLDTCVFRPLSQKKSFKVHVKTVHSTNRDAKPKIVSCHICSRQFANARSCSTHVTQAHGTAGKFKCKLCKEILQTADERKLHYLLRHPGRHPFECTECGKSFQYKSSLYMHKQEHQPNRQSYTCAYCGKVFAKKDSYREHVQIHEGPRHACSYCPMRFVQRSNMLRHERRHTGERPYTCPHCPKTFADKGACTSHARTHLKDRSYACLYCGQTFLQKSKLKYHIRRHTGENLETCTVCSKLFTSACSLREHMKTHAEKSDNVKCPICDKKYHDERYMLRHMRSIHTNKLYKCPICPKGVTSISALRHHVMTHSPLNMFRCKCCKKSYNVRRTMIKHLRKRHGLNGADITVKDYYTKLEPRECNLKLDETTMNSIFGPPKRKVPHLIGDFVTFTKRLKLAENLDQNTDDTEEGDEQGSDGDDEKGANKTQKDTDTQPQPFTQVVCKQEVVDNEYELEPTDFVSVKIEPIEEEHNDI